MEDYKLSRGEHDSEIMCASYGFSFFLLESKLRNLKLVALLASLRIVIFQHQNGKEMWLCGRIFMRL